MDRSKMPSAGCFWQSLVVGLMVVGIAGLAATFITIARRGSPVVDGDYYLHGLHYGSDRQRQRNGEQLGWRIEAGMENGLLLLKVRDGRGEPVSGGRLTLTLVEGPARGKRGGGDAWAEGVPLTGAEQGAGVYAVALSREQSGDLHGKITFASGDALLSERVLILR